MHKSLLNIGLAAVLVLLLVCCGAAGADDVAEIGDQKFATVQAAVDVAPHGSTIEMIDNSSESTVVVSNQVTLDLHGFVLRNNGTAKTVEGKSSKSVLYVNSTGNLTVQDSGATVHYFKYKSSGAWENTTDSTGAISISAFNRSTAVSDPSIIYYVEGGVITNGTGAKVGSASTDYYGGGVYVFSGTFNMSRGDITENTATNNGGGVYVYSGKTFNMQGGNITENSAKNGGGVYNDGTFNVKNTPVIKDNENSTAATNNVYLPNTKYITIISALQNGAKIGVTTQTPPKPTSPLVNITEDSGDNRTYFASDNTSYEINYLNNKHALVYRYGITYRDNGDTAFSGTHESDYPTTHTYGTATTLKGATKAEQTFGGWFMESDCSGTVVISLVATESSATGAIKLYAKWTANPQPVPPSSSSSSRSYGASVWLTATPTPTPVPADVSGTNATQTPTAAPVKPQQTSTPAPVAGILAGLGAAALVFGLRRK